MVNALLCMAILAATHPSSCFTRAFSLSINQLDKIKLPTLKFPDLNLPSKAKTTFTYTHLEGNGQLWQFSRLGKNKDVSIVVDPLASQLDFGIPWGYRANKKVLSEQETIDKICNSSNPPTHCLLTMGLDDHTHLPTILKLKERLPNLKYVVAPTCETKLMEGAGVERERITVLKHGESCDLDGLDVRVTATEGALVGPPWQTRENGYVVQIKGIDGSSSNADTDLSVYYEPHSDVVLENLQKMGPVRADIMVSPITKQSLPANVPPQGQYTLVYGGDRTLEIADSIGARVVIPLGNGALDIDGPLAGLVDAQGDLAGFEELVALRNSKRGEDGAIRVEKSSPGVPLSVAV